ncbi:EamA family transporter, partial [Escherichia coli]|uniref:EamA family transporter n=1 Tax=Escherichia coli TaxID=562 RepID=UPI0020239825
RRRNAWFYYFLYMKLKQQTVRLSRRTSTALPYSLEMIALTRLPTRTFGTLMSMEPALAAVSGMIFLGETLTPIQLLALGAIIAASMGSTLTVRKESKIKELDIN